MCRVGSTLCFWGIWVVGAVLGGCHVNTDASAGQSTPVAVVQPGSCGLPVDGLDAESQVRLVVQSEGSLMVQRNIEPLMALWAADAEIVDAHNTPTDPNDDQVWSGQDAIRHRYLYWVFPSAPDSFEPATQLVTMQGNQAVVQGTTRIGNEDSPMGDQWLLTKENGCWVIQQLIYNLEK